MSIRTIIEVNHDTLDDLTKPEIIEQLLRDIRSGAVNRPDAKFLRYGNIRVLGQRHHSETLKLTVK